MLITLFLLFFFSVPLTPSKKRERILIHAKINIWRMICIKHILIGVYYLFIYLYEKNSYYVVFILFMVKKIIARGQWKGHKDRSWMRGVTCKGSVKCNKCLPSDKGGNEKHVLGVVAGEWVMHNIWLFGSREKSQVQREIAILPSKLPKRDKPHWFNLKQLHYKSNPTQPILIQIDSYFSNNNLKQHASHARTYLTFQCFAIAITC